MSKYECETSVMSTQVENGGYAFFALCDFLFPMCFVVRWHNFESVQFAENYTSLPASGCTRVQFLANPSARKQRRSRWIYWIVVSDELGRLMVCIDH